MNTEEKFVHPDIESLKTETSRHTLRAQILNQLQKREDKTMRTGTRFLRAGLSAGIITAIAVGTLVLTNTANAIPRIKAALQDASRYHVTSYQVVNGARRKVAETWVDGDHSRINLFDEKGKQIELNQDLQDITLKMGEKIKLLSPDQVADDQTLELVLKDVVLKAGQGGGNDQLDIIVTDEHGKAEPALPGKVIQKDGSIELSMNGGSVSIMPMLVGGENGVQYLRKLLSDKELWNIELGVHLNGRVLDKYSLKDGLMNFMLFVDPVSELPIMTRTRMGEGVFEDEYDYVSVMPKQAK